MGNKLGENRLTILKLTSENPNITQSEIATHLNVSDTAVENNIKFLKENGYLKRVGPPKGGHWIVQKNNL